MEQRRFFRYGQSVKLNGSELSRAFLSHADLTADGELIPETGERPNRAWGLAQ